MRTLRAGGSLVALALFPVLLVGLLAVLVWVIWLAFSGARAAVGVKLLFLAVPFAYAVVFAGREVWRARATPAVGHEVRRGAHNRLWAAADEAAAAVGTQPAERLVVVPDVNAAVTQAAGRRELLVGLPLLATLTTGELRSVLAHEFGHFGAGHTRLTSVTWRARVLIGEVAERTDGVVGWLVRAYAKLATRLTAASSRDQEWEADGYAARLTDPATAASALRRVVDADLAMKVLMQTHYPLTGPAARRAPIAEGLISTTAARRQLLDETSREVLESDSKGAWSDTHPPLRQRIAAFEAMVSERADAPADASSGQGDPPAYELLDEGLTSFDPIELTLTGDTDPKATWDEVAAAAGRRLSNDRVNAYLDQTGLRAQVRTIGDVIDLASRPETRAAVTPLVASEVLTLERDEAATELVTDFVASAVAATLTSTGLARFVVDWNELWDLRHEDGRDIALRDRVAATVADPTTAPQLRGYLAELGLDLDTPVPEPAATTGAEPGALSGG